MQTNRKVNGSTHQNGVREIHMRLIWTLPLERVRYRRTRDVAGCSIEETSTDQGETQTEPAKEATQGTG